MTFEIASEMFQKFKTLEFEKTAKVVAWLYRRFGYNTTIERTYVPSLINEKPFADYWTVFGIRSQKRKWWQIL